MKRKASGAVASRRTGCGDKRETDHVTHELEWANGHALALAALVCPQVLAAPPGLTDSASMEVRLEL